MLRTLSVEKPGALPEREEFVNPRHARLSRFVE
jgi:hypothetical protein